MPNHIDFETKSDRELLVLVAQMTNTINDSKLPTIVKQLDELNNIVDEHSRKLLEMETMCQVRHNRSNKKLSAIVAGITSGVMTAVYLLGNLCDWW